MKKGKEANGDAGEKSPKLKNGLSQPSEEEVDIPKPKKMKKGKEASGDAGEKSPRLKDGLSQPSEPKSNSSDAPGEESSSETEKVSVCLCSLCVCVCADNTCRASAREIGRAHV